MIKFRFAGFFLAAAVLCSCAASGDKASFQSFVFDTYAQYSVNGKDAENVLLNVSESFDGMSAAFAECYGKEASELPENELYSLCCGQTFALAEKYGGGVNVTCGALTELWGISTPEPKVPEDEEISAALGTIINGYTESFPEGTRLDFGAVAKGYACDEAYRILSETETDYAVISLSSTTLMYGEKSNGEKFRAGVTNPESGSGYMGIIETDAAFVSTSGGYERYFESGGKRYCHILDVSTGKPVETDLVSVTVIVPAETAGGGIMSDFLSTLIFTEGTENLDRWLAYEDFEIVAADENGKVYTDCKGFVLDKSSGFYYG